MEKKKRRGLKWLNLLWVLPLAAVIIAVVVTYVVPAFENPFSWAVEDSADWMRNLPDEKPLSEVILPGTHDSAAAHPDIPFITRCQSYEIDEQLSAGYRYLDIRLGERNGRLVLMHGFTLCRKAAFPWSEPLYVEDVLGDCEAFLDEHPSETVIFAVKHEHGDASAADFAAMLETALETIGDKLLDTHDIPTVGEARGKLVLMRRYADSTLPADADCAGIPMIWEDQGDNSDTSRDAEPTENGSYTLWVQDRYAYGTEDKWRAFTDGMEKAPTSPTDVALNFLSTKGTGAYGHPYHYADLLGDRLYNLEKEKLNGWIIVDFGNEQLAGSIWHANFR